MMRHITLLLPVVLLALLGGCSGQDERQSKVMKKTPRAETAAVNPARYEGCHFGTRTDDIGGDVIFYVSSTADPDHVVIIWRWEGAHVPHGGSNGQRRFTGRITKNSTLVFDGSWSRTSVRPRTKGIEIAMAPRPGKNGPYTSFAARKCTSKEADRVRVVAHPSVPVRSAMVNAG